MKEPFHIRVEQAVLDDLLRHLAQTRWAEDPGGSNGAYLRALVAYWQSATTGATTRRA